MGAWGRVLTRSGPREHPHCLCDILWIRFRTVFHTKNSKVCGTLDPLRWTANSGVRTASNTEHLVINVLQPRSTLFLVGHELALAPLRRRCCWGGTCDTMQKPEYSGGIVHVHNSLTICTLLLQAAQRHTVPNTNAREAVEMPVPRPLPLHHCTAQLMVVFTIVNTLLRMPPQTKHRSCRKLLRQHPTSWGATMVERAWPADLAAGFPQDWGQTNSANHCGCHCAWPPSAPECHVV